MNLLANRIDAQYYAIVLLSIAAVSIGSPQIVEPDCTQASQTSSMFDEVPEVPRVSVEIKYGHWKLENLAAHSSGFGTLLHWHR